MEKSVKYRVFHCFEPKGIQQDQELLLQHLSQKAVTFQLLLLTIIQFLTSKDYSRTVAMSESEASKHIKICWYYKAL